MVLLRFLAGALLAPSLLLFGVGEVEGFAGTSAGKAFEEEEKYEVEGVTAVATKGVVAAVAAAIKGFNLLSADKAGFELSCNTIGCASFKRFGMR